MWSYLRRIASLPFRAFAALLLTLLLSAVQCVTEGPSLAGYGTATVTVQNSSGFGMGGMTVKLVGTTLASMTNESGVATLIAPGGDYDLRVLYIGCAPVIQPITIPAGANTATTVTVSCPSSDVVLDDAWPAESRIWLMDLASDPLGSATCRNDLLLHGTGQQVISGNATSTDALGANCHLASLVLAADRAPFFSNTAADFNWTPTLGNVFAPTMPAVKLQLPIRIIISDAGLSPTGKSDLKTDIETSELLLATQALQDSYSGITLVDEAGGAPQITINDGVETLLKGGCGSAAAIRANSAIYSPHRINVYYIDLVRNEEGVAGDLGFEKAGYTCNTSDAPNIIFIDHDGHVASTLAHEIGHALGLISPMWGHGDWYAGLYEDASGRPLNMMADGQFLVVYDYDGNYLPADPQYFSVGQVSRMHLGNSSWLNLPSPVDALTLRARQSMPGASAAVACGCPETAATDDCAAPSTDIDRSAIGTPRPVLDDFYMSCSVTPTAPTSVTICVGKSVQSEAKFFQGTEPGEGASSMWVAMDNTKVKALSAGAPPASNIMKGDLTGLAVGNTIVRAYADGAFATFNVKVDPPCP